MSEILLACRNPSGVIPERSSRPNAEDWESGMTRCLTEVAIEPSRSANIQGNAMRPTAQHLGVAQFQGDYVKPLLFQKLD